MYNRCCGTVFLETPLFLASFWSMWRQYNFARATTATTTASNNENATQDRSSFCPGQFSFFINESAGFFIPNKPNSGRFKSEYRKSTDPNMKGIKDVHICLYIYFTMIFVLPYVISLRITLESATKLLNQTFVVLCKDEAGQSVTWRGPKGLLGLKTRPYVQTSSYGTAIVFNQTVAEDAGTYVCSAGNEKRTFNLTIENKPVFPLPTYAQHEQAYGYINGTVNLTCIVIADPSPRFEWHRSTSDRNNKQLTGRIFNISNDISILQLHITDRKTFGEYKCIATNPYGRLEKHFSLDEGFKPSPPASIILRDASSKLLDLVIHGPKKTTIRTNDIENEIPGMETVGYRLQYRDVESDDWQMVDFNVTKDNSYQLEDLTPATKYAIRAATRNPAGLSDYSNVYTFHTLNSAINFNYLTTSQQFILILMNFSVIYTSRFLNNLC